MTYYIQGERENIRDFIFPIVTARQEKDGIRSFLGSGFLIGKRGFALTACHVVETYNEIIGTLFVTVDNRWRFLKIDKIESHPSEDVAIIHIENPNYEWKTPFKIDEKNQYGLLDYMLGGYPADIVWGEIIIDPNFGKMVQMKPDLVSIKGYIRRRYNNNLDIRDIKGTQFYELSTIAGKGCSGAPLFYVKNKIWNVIGIYVAERRKYKDDNLGTYVSLDVSYAVRSNSFYNWKPDSLSGFSIGEESLNYII